jgi:ATP-dependent protease ClpP protease subunit
MTILRKRLLLIGSIVLLLASAATTTALFLYRFDILNYLIRYNEFMGHAHVLTGIALAAALLSLCLVALSWRKMRGHGPSVVKGSAFLISAVITLLQACGAYSFYTTAEDTEKTLLGMRYMGNAVVTQVALGHILVKGPIGQSIIDDILTYDTQQIPLKLIEIESEGGLVDKALALASIIEIKKIEVLVDDYCISACTLIAVASTHLKAHQNSVFGFHRTYAIAETSSELFKVGAGQLGVESRSFLKSHGVSEAVLSEADKFGPDETYDVSAAEMAKAGIVKEVLQ